MSSDDEDWDRSHLERLAKDIQGAKVAAAELAALRAQVEALRAERDELMAKLSASNGALQELQVRMFDAVVTAEQERDAARAQRDALLPVARAAVNWHEADDLTADDRLHDMFAAITALDPSMLKEVVMGEPIYCGACRAYLGNTAHDCAAARTGPGGTADPRDARIAELEVALRAHILYYGGAGHNRADCPGDCRSCDVDAEVERALRGAT